MTHIVTTRPATGNKNKYSLKAKRIYKWNNNKYLINLEYDRKRSKTKEYMIQTENSLNST